VTLEKDYNDWHGAVSAEIRECLGRAPHSHFSVLGGFSAMSWEQKYDGRHNDLLTQIHVSIERLKEVIAKASDG
jgi:hypothetical protein